MVTWLIPISLFWILDAMYLGGAEIDIEGGGGGRQLSGLLLHFVAFLGVYAVARMLLVGLAGAELAIVFAMIIATALLPILARLSFRVAGVRITSAATP
jgi:hypothetical protein